MIVNTGRTGLLYNSNCQPSGTRRGTLASSSSLRPGCLHQAQRQVLIHVTAAASAEVIPPPQAVSSTPSGLMMLTHHRRSASAFASSWIFQIV